MRTLLINPPPVNGIAFTRQGRCQEREEVLGTTKPPYSLLVCAALHDTSYDVPNHGSCCRTPALDVTASVRVAVGTRKLAGGCSWLFRWTLVLTVGPNAPAAAATRVSLICGSSRAARRSTL